MGGQTWGQQGDLISLLTNICVLWGGGGGRYSQMDTQTAFDLISLLTYICVWGGGEIHRWIQGQQGDLITLFVFFKVRNVGKKWLI
jgi:hypothetical protein